MSVKAVQLSQTGLIPNTQGLGLNLSQQLPTPIYIETNDPVATVLVSGYLNKSRSDFQFPYTNQQMALVWTNDNGGQTQWLAVAVTGTAPNYVYSLVAPTADGVVATPTVANQITYATNTGGALAASGLATALFNAGNISAGTSGTAGLLASFPATATTGSLRLAAVANTGNTTTTISNVAYGQASTLSFADVGSAAGRFLVANTATPFTSGHLVAASGTGGLTVDAGFQMKSVTAAVNAGGSATTTVTDAFCTALSTVVANWNTSANAVNIQKVTPGVGSFTVLSSGDPGASTLGYIITKTT